MLYHNGFLYESTGINFYSSLRRLDVQTGQILKRVDLPGSYFAEGLAFKDGQLVQLTYTSGKALIYSLPDMVQTGFFSYGGQGWGLTTDASRYIMSNGSDTLYFRDASFRITGRVGVIYDGRQLRDLNELEYVNGKVYANVWHSSSIFAVDPQTGAVIEVIDCTNLVEIVGPTSQGNVLNGIAYNDSSGSFYLTGKRWPYIFEVKLRKK